MKNTRNNASLQPVRHRLKLPLGWPLDRRFRLTNKCSARDQCTFIYDYFFFFSFVDKRNEYIYTFQIDRFI